MNRILLCLLLASIQIPTSAHIPNHGMFILMHGSLGRNGSWYQKGGLFYEYLEQAIATHFGFTLHSYAWSGSVNDRGIIQAGHDIAHYLLSLPAGIRKDFGCHSNGGNAVAFATKLLKVILTPTLDFSGKPDLSELHLPFERTIMTKQYGTQKYVPHMIIHDIIKAVESLTRQATLQMPSRSLPPLYFIEDVYLMGTPINTDRFDIDMDVVHHVYNLYSLGDKIQIMVGNNKLPAHARRINLEVSLHQDNKTYAPCHTNMHHHFIGKWLPLIPRILAKDRLDPAVTTFNDGTITFYEDTEPIFSAQKR